jgi:hypothetical protein
MGEWRVRVAEYRARDVPGGLVSLMRDYLTKWLQ